MEFKKALLERNIRALLSDKLHIDCFSVPGSTTLSDGLGIDSLALSDLAEAIEERFDIPIPNRMLPGTLTIHQLVNLLYDAIEAADMQAAPVMVETAS